VREAPHGSATQNLAMPHPQFSLQIDANDGDRHSVNASIRFQRLKAYDRYK
jgi:hypothetical protein